MLVFVFQTQLLMISGKAISWQNRPVLKEPTLSLVRTGICFLGFIVFKSAAFDTIFHCENSLIRTVNGQNVFMSQESFGLRWSNLILSRLDSISYRLSQTSSHVIRCIFFISFHILYFIFVFSSWLIPCTPFFCRRYFTDSSQVCYQKQRGLVRIDCCPKYDQ